jgi:hypothetical protein
MRGTPAEHRHVDRIRPFPGYEIHGIVDPRERQVWPISIQSVSNRPINPHLVSDKTQRR